MHFSPVKIAFVNNEKSPVVLDQKNNAWISTLPRFCGPVQQSMFEDFDYILSADENGQWAIFFKSLQEKKLQSVKLDFLEPSLLRRINPSTIGGEHVVKAVCGRRRSDKLKVLDVTAGFGVDALLLAASGCEVMAIERSVVLSFLWREAMCRAYESSDENFRSLLARIDFIEGDSLKLMRNWQFDWQPDVVYVDPMFPARVKSAAIKKGMQFLHGLISSEEDGDLLVAAASIARSKVVVKRPANSAYLSNKKPASSLNGKVTRFDVYPV